MTLTATPTNPRFHRLLHSPVLWSWAFQGLRVASGLILLPLVLRPEIMGGNDLGMYWVFMELSSLVILFDFGFSPSVGRNVSYAMAGATHLKAEGLVDTPAGGQPNRALLWQLLHSTQRLFLVLSLAALVVIGIVGSLTVASRVQETSHPELTWTAWALVLGASVLEIYAGWWNTYLRGLNQVLPSARIAAIAYALRLVLASGFLIAGWGLMALPVAGLISSTVHRSFSKRRCLAFLGAAPATVPSESLLAVLWPNSWRTGLQFLSVYLATRANTLICSHYLGLNVTSSYGLTAQVTQLISSMALVWCSVKWPLVGQLGKLQNTEALRKLLWPRLWMQTLTFLVLALAAVPIGPLALEFLRSERQLLPTGMFLGMLAYGFFETQFVFWTTLLSLVRNRIPSLWPTVITNVTTILLVFLLFRRLGVAPSDPNDISEWLRQGLSILTFTPLAVAALFNFWFWPILGARELRTRWLRFMVTGK